MNEKEEDALIEAMTRAIAKAMRVQMPNDLSLLWNWNNDQARCFVAANMALAAYLSHTQEIGMTPAQDLEAQAAINAHEAIACAWTKAHTSETGVCDDPPAAKHIKAEDEGAAA